jgi:flagellar motor switch protein FliM
MAERILDGGTAAVLRRKAERARATALDARGPVTPAGALAEAFRRAGEEELDLAIQPAGTRHRRASVAEILDALPEHAFLALLTGPDNGTGLMWLDPPALSAVIEMRTKGHVSSRPPQPRRPTPTDAALVSDLVDSILARFAASLAGTTAEAWAAGWRYQLYLPEPRPLAVVLEDATHQVVEAELGFGAAAKSGRVLLALPAAGRALPRAVPPPTPGSFEAMRAESWSRALGEAIGNAEVTLDAVLGRVRLTIGGLAALAPGDRIALPAEALAALRLVTGDGAPVAAGRLGQAGGARAVRLIAADGPLPPIQPDGAVIPAGAFLRNAGAGGAGHEGAGLPAAGAAPDGFAAAGFAAGLAAGPDATGGGFGGPAPWGEAGSDPAGAPASDAVRFDPSGL